MRSCQPARLILIQYKFNSILNMLFFHCAIGKIAIRKDFQLKFFHKKAFP